MEPKTPPSPTLKHPPKQCENPHPRIIPSLPSTQCITTLVHNAYDPNVYRLLDSSGIRTYLKGHKNPEDPDDADDDDYFFETESENEEGESEGDGEDEVVMETGSKKTHKCMGGKRKGKGKGVGEGMDELTAMEMGLGFEPLEKKQKNVLLEVARKKLLEPPKIVSSGVCLEGEKERSMINDVLNGNHEGWSVEFEKGAKKVGDFYEKLKKGKSQRIGCL